MTRARMWRRLTFVIYRDRAREFRWRLLAGNRKTIADSAEGYKRIGHCRSIVDIMRCSLLRSGVVEKL